MCPGSISCESTPEPAIPQAIAVGAEEAAVEKEAATEPVTAPSPTAPATPTAIKSADGDPETPPEPVGRIVQRRVIAPGWRTPNVSRVVSRDINHLRVSRLNRDGALSVLRLGGHPFLRGTLQLAVGLSASPQP